MGSVGWCLFLGEKKTQLEQSSLMELKKRRQFGWKISSAASQPALDLLCALIKRVSVQIRWLVAEQNMKDSRELNLT